MESGNDSSPAATGELVPVTGAHSPAAVAAAYLASLAGGRRLRIGSRKSPMAIA